MKLFSQYANTEEHVDSSDKINERGQRHPAYWHTNSEAEDSKGTNWSGLSWQPLLKSEQLNDSHAGSSVAVKRGDTQLAIFKMKGKYYASQQMCLHKRAFVLSDGLIGEDNQKEKLWISCPMHKRNFELKGHSAGNCLADESLSIATFPVEAREDGFVYVRLPPVQELDEVLGTSKWKLKKDDGVDPFESVDKRLKAMKMKGRKSVHASHLTNGIGQAGKAREILAGGERRASGMDW